MRTLHAVHMRDPSDWFSDLVTEFVTRYDRVNDEWRGPLYERPSFDPSAPSSSQQPPLSVSHKRLREVLIFDVIFDSIYLLPFSSFY